MGYEKVTKSSYSTISFLPIVILINFIKEYEKGEEKKEKGERPKVIQWYILKNN